MGPMRSITERVDIESGWTGNQQEAEFTNATLQSTGNMEFSIGVHVEIPTSIDTEPALFGYLMGVFGQVTEQFPQLHVEIKLGLGEDD